MLAEVTKWTETLANADDCLQALADSFDDDGRVVG